GSVKSPLDLSQEEWDHVFKTNLTGCWLVSKYICKHMRDVQRKGSVINISSTSGLNRGNLSGAVAYASSKAGVNMLTKAPPDPQQVGSKVMVWLPSNLVTMVCVGFATNPDLDATTEISDCSDC
ncbi:putative NAD(P)-binding rossmann-fold protein, partial [Trifolium pratense]